MSYFQDGEPNRRSRPSIFPIFLVALFAALFGGVASHYLAPQLGQARLGQQPGVQQPAQQAPPGPSYDEALLSNRIAGIAKEVGPSVVGITNRGRGGLFGRSAQEQGTGSGVIFDPNGYIVTNNHVVEKADQLLVSLADGRTAEAKLIGTDKRTDLAVIKIELDNLRAVPWADSSQLQVGELAIAIGNPGGKEFFGSVTAGIISGLNRELEGAEGQIARLIQTDAAINPGNSGGALVNGRGQLIGINSIKIALQGFEGMGFSIPSNTVREIVESIKNTGKVTRPALGVGIQEIRIDATLARRYNLIVDYGVAVVPLPGGPAEKAGIKENDIIIALNGKEIRNDIALMREISSFKPGDVVTVTVVRDNKKHDIQVTLGELTQ